VYQQGYGLGERLADAYDLGQISKRQIRRLFGGGFRKDGKAVQEFLRLKNNLWN